MRFSWTSLAVRKDCEVVAFWNFRYVLWEQIEEVLLIGGFGEGLIKLDGKWSYSIGRYVDSFTLV